MIALAIGLVLGHVPAPTDPSRPEDSPPAVEWTLANAEHLLNRAGFGAGPEELAAVVEAGLDATVDGLIDIARAKKVPFFAERLSLRDGLFAEERMAARMDGMEDTSFREENREMIEAARDEDADQRDRFLGWWVARMLEGDDPLGERMTLFWHGWFTSSYRDVKSSYEMIAQNQLFRDLAVGKFGDLLHAVSRDPAMLEYLDNDSNRRRNPNENFARELMELFTLGEGNYTEQDVKEAARAFTGWTDDHGAFRFEWRRHDFDHKTVLGRTGRLDGDDVIEILLEQEACSRYLAEGLLTYFEGQEPSEERLARYAGLLAERDYDLAAFLRTLFKDPEFYRDEVVGNRIAGPIDFLVGSSRRLGIAPPGRAICMGAAALGQKLFDPPNVRGWEGGEAWITTGTLMLRSNLIGAYLGAERRGDGEERGAEREKVARALRRAQWGPNLNFSARLHRANATTDEAVADFLLDTLLAVEASPEGRAEVVAFLAAEREALSLSDGELLEARRRSERALRKAAHFVLSLPEANLN